MTWDQLKWNLFLLLGNWSIVLLWWWTLAQKVLTLVLTLDLRTYLFLQQPTCPQIFNPNNARQTRVLKTLRINISVRNTNFKEPMRWLKCTRKKSWHFNEVKVHWETLSDQGQGSYLPCTQFEVEKSIVLLCSFGVFPAFFLGTSISVACPLVTVQLWWIFLL